MIRITVIHGPHLNMLGKREQGHYGCLTLKQVNERIETHACGMKINVEFYQSDNESDIVNRIHQASENADGIILNPAGLGHSSLMLRDAVILCKKPVIEVHLSNIQARESFRRKTIIADVCRGQISGLNWTGYVAALQALTLIIEEDSESR
jgi:3-dehydroquinate dehydratase II